MSPQVRLYDHHKTLISLSGGKDSLGMLAEVIERADAEGYPRSRIVAVHADMGRVDWPGTVQAAADHAAAYGLRFEVVKRESGDLLDHVRQRRANLDRAARELWAEADALRAAGDTEQAEKVAAAGDKKWNAPAWPSMPPARWCTSDHKRGPILKLITRLSVEWYADNPGEAGPFRILQAIGLRSEESSERQKHKPLSTNRKSSGRRTITDWLPIQDWLVGTVWDTIQRSGVPYHYAYDLGICRVGCVFCFYKTRAELALSALHNPELADAFAAMEVEARSTFKHGLSMSDVIADAKQLRESARSGPAELTRAG